MRAPVYVVSGLPRSGTSLVMQMLAAGGMRLLSDSERPADEDNPRGYCELEAVKRLRHDAAWIATARGKAVKVISHLLEFLPAGEDYRVIIVERSLDEVLASQAKMIARRAEPAPPEAMVRQAFEAHSHALERLLRSRPDIAAMRIRYAAIVADPAAAAQQLSHFVGDKLASDNMAAAVDPSLYRNRSSGL